MTTALTPTLWQIFTSELLGTFLLMLLGTGLVAGVVLPRAKSHAAGWVAITLGWGLAVFIAVYAAYATGGHINPAVTIGLALAGRDLAPGIPATLTNISVYIAAQFIGAFLGSTTAYVVYKKHFDEPAPAEDKLAPFSNSPAIRSYGHNLLGEAVATFVLMVWILGSHKTPSELGPFAVALVFVGIGLCLGGTTGYSINPARDLAPRVAHAILPIRGKGSSDWAYSWVPVVGPILGSAAAAILVPHLGGLF